MDDLAGLGDEQDAPAVTPPAAPALDIESLKAQVAADLKADLDQRVAGFQRLLDKKDKELAKASAELRQWQESAMSDSEVEALRESERDAEIARLRAENQLLALAGDYSEEVALQRALLTASTPEDAVKLLRSFRQPAASQQQTPAPEPEPEVPSVDPNNPRAMFEVGSQGASFNGRQIDDNWADTILGAASQPTRTYFP